MRRGLVSLLLASIIVIISFLVGCSSQNNTESGNNESQVREETVGDGSDAVPDEELEAVSSTADYAYDENAFEENLDSVVGSLNGLCRLNADGSTVTRIGTGETVSHLLSSYYGRFEGTPDSNDELHYYFISAFYPNYIEVSVNRSVGEQLIIVGASMRSVFNSYEHGEVIALDSVREHAYWPGYNNSIDLANCEVINDIDVASAYHENLTDGVNEALAGTGLRAIAYPTSINFQETIRSIVSDTPQTISFGQYYGTDYVEDTIQLSTPYYLTAVTSNTRHLLPYEKTKEGYFVVDLSGLPAGLYTAEVEPGEFQVFSIV